MKRILLLTTLTFLLLIVIVEAQVPRYFTLQGRLLNKTTGMPEVGTKQFNFTLFDALSGGNVVWGPKIQNVPVGSDGSFTTIVGPFHEALSFNIPYYLEVRVQGELFGQRINLTSVPYSISIPNIYYDGAQIIANEDLRITGNLSVAGIENVFGPEGGGRHIIVNDIAGAKWALATGSYDLTFYKHKSDTNTWETALIMQGNAANYLPQGFSFFANGIERLTIAPTGNIGIGTTSPGYDKLDIQGRGWRIKNPTADAVAVIDSGDAATPRYSAIDLYHNGSAKWGFGKRDNAAGDFYIDNTGVGNALTILKSNSNVGIGTNTPPAKVTIAGASSLPAGLEVKYSDVSLVSYINSADGTNAGSIQVRSGGTATTIGPNNYILALNPLGGNVGIGTTNPQTKLHVKGTGDVAYFGQETSAPRARIWAGGAGTAADPYRVVFGSVDSNTQTRLNIGGTDYLTVATNGNVGIGTTEPKEKLDIVESIRIRGWDAVLHSYDNAGRYHDLIGTYQGWNPEAIYIAGYNAVNNPTARNTTKVSIGGSGSERLWVDLTTGNVGIGTTNPQYKLAVTGTTNAIYSYINEPDATADNRQAIYGYRTRTVRNDGSGYGVSQTNAAIKGYNYWGDAYTFGVAGYSFNDYTRTGGVIGAVQSGTYWGALGYKDENSNTWGVYTPNDAYVGGQLTLSKATTTSSTTEWDPADHPYGTSCSSDKFYDDPISITVSAGKYLIIYNGHWICSRTDTHCHNWGYVALKYAGSLASTTYRGIESPLYTGSMENQFTVIDYATFTTTTTINGAVCPVEGSSPGNIKIEQRVLIAIPF